MSACLLRVSTIKYWVNKHYTKNAIASGLSSIKNAYILRFSNLTKALLTQ